MGTLTPFEDKKKFRPTDSYHEWLGPTSTSQKIRAMFRNLTIGALSVGKDIKNTANWIRFPYYHHVFSDEMRGFEHQIRYLKNFGEFIGLNDATNLLNTGKEIKGRYFCLTFDDGLSCCYKYALPIISDLEIPATFYVVTNMVGKSFEPASLVARGVFGFKGQNTSVEFLTWDQCRASVQVGVTIGSHTKSHRKLSDLTLNEVRTELIESKLEIETHTGIVCEHFCAPYGFPGKDFDLKRDGQLARESGYRSFATGCRGVNKIGDSSFALKRDHLLANWGIPQLRYFFSTL